jgi:SAM-dependent methyltransferase
VLEIGPGTGQATRRLLELDADVVAVEPDPGLREYVATRTSRPLVVLSDPLEAVDLPSGEFDLAVAASSFHWVEEDVGLSRLFRALRPDGWIALWWTLFGVGEHPDRFQGELQPVLDDLYSAEGIEPGRSPSSGTAGGPRFAMDVPSRRAALVRAGFTQVEHELIRWQHTWDSASIRALYASFSPVLRLEPASRAAVLDAVGRIADDRFGGRVELGLETSLYTARRPPGRRRGGLQRGGREP